MFTKRTSKANREMTLDPPLFDGLAWIPICFCGGLVCVCEWCAWFWKDWGGTVMPGLASRSQAGPSQVGGVSPLWQQECVCYSFGVWRKLSP